MKENINTNSIKDLGKYSTNDHIINGIKAVLNSFPFCGGIASLISDYIPSSKNDRLISFTKQIAADFEGLNEKIDNPNLQTDEFTHILEGCFRGVSENYQKIKIEAFRGILLNSAIGFDSTTDEKEYFLGLVNSLSVLHIKILLFMNTPKRYLQYYKIDEAEINGDFEKMFRIAIPETNTEVVKSAYSDLFQKGFLSTDKSIFSTMTSSQGLSLLGNRVTDIGKRFVEFCLFE